MFNFYSVDNERYKYMPFYLAKNEEEQKKADEYSNITIPIGKKSSEENSYNLSATNNIPLVNNKKDSSMGLEIQSQNKSGQKNEEQVPPQKKGSTLTDALTRFYGKKYTEASEEKKEELIVKYFDWLRTEKKSTISQIDQFKLYRERCTDDAEYKLLSSVIDKLEAGYQYSAAKIVVTEGTTKQRHIGQIAVAEDIHNYDKSVQLDATELIIESKNEEAIKISASHASELHEENQVQAVEIYQKAEMPDEFKKRIDIILINQYERFAKENQVNIHKIMSNSKFSETVEYAAKNICKLNEQNQAEAYKYTVSTGNEEAITAANSQWYNYADSAKAEITASNQFTSLGSSQTTTKTYNASISEKIENIKNIVENNQGPNALSEQIKKLSDNEILFLLKNYPNSDVIQAILDNNPTPTVLNSLNETYLKEIDYKKLGSNISFLSLSSQLYIIRKSASEGTLSEINKNLLLDSVKVEYDKLIKVQKKDKKA